MIPERVVSALRDLHPDPFVQAAILRLYKEAPGLLDPTPLYALHEAHEAATTTTRTDQEN